MPSSGKVRPFFAGYPATRELRDKDGRLSGFRIKAVHLPPLLARAADWSAYGTAIGLAVGGYFFSRTFFPGADLVMVVLIVGPLASYPVLRWVLRRLWRWSRTIDITEDEVVVHGLGRAVRYDRSTSHGYMLQAHDKAKDEAERQQWDARQRAQTERPVKYYQESWHVVFQYGRERIDLMTVFGEKQAHAILNRLLDCDQVMDGDMQIEPGRVYQSGPGGPPLKENRR